MGNRRLVLFDCYRPDLPCGCLCQLIMSVTTNNSIRGTCKKLTSESLVECLPSLKNRPHAMNNACQTNRENMKNLVNKRYRVSGDLNPYFLSGR